MRTRILGLISIGLLFLGVSLLAAPVRSDAVLVTNVTVTETQGAFATTWCIVGCANNIWAAGGGTNLLPGQSLVLTQTVGFNFDSSEGVFNNIGCQGGGAFACTVTLNVNGTNIPLAANNAINNFNLDTNPLGNAHNEATDWTSVGSLSGLSIFIGYADDAHTILALMRMALVSPRILGRDRPIPHLLGRHSTPEPLVVVTGLA